MIPFSDGGGIGMRGTEARAGQPFNYVELESRVRRDHPLRIIREVANEALTALATDFSTLYSRVDVRSARATVRTMLLQAFGTAVDGAA